jgi:hypothetical protein
VKESLSIWPLREIAIELKVKKRSKEFIPKIKQLRLEAIDYK